MKSKLFKQDDNWFVKVKDTVEGDDVVFHSIPLSQSDYNYSLVEGLELEFDIVKDIYTDLGEEVFEFATISTRRIKKEYFEVVSSGMFFEFFPQMKGNWEEDKELFISFWIDRKVRMEFYGN